MASRVSKQDAIVSIGGWKEDTRDALLLSPPFFFHFHPVFGKNGQNNRLTPPPLSSVQTTRKRTLKQNFSLMFAVYPLIFTVRNEVAKVMFLHLSVCPQGGVCLSACWDTTPPSTQEQAPPQEQTPPLGPDPPSRHPPPTQQTATVADGTHPTGMHSCFHMFFDLFRFRFHFHSV